MSSGVARTLGYGLVGCLVSLAAAAQPSYSPHAGTDFPRQVHWGDTHVHSAWSVDAGNQGNLEIGPGEAYRFARGEEITAHNGMAVKLRRPLDFFLLSDHAEFLGVLPRLDEGDPLARSTEGGERWYQLRSTGNAGALWGEFVKAMRSGTDPVANPELQADIWKQVVANAERYNQPGVFTAFIGYEYTSSPDGDNLHRNVMFRDGAERTGQTVPFSSLESPNPEDLWRALETYERETGGRVLAIPHNSNLSGGRMFASETFDGQPITREYAETRARWEPLVEATQYKGDSEAHPFTSPDDEFADYESWDSVTVGGRRAGNASVAHSYVRPALKQGLGLQAEHGVNPFKLGMIGSTDAHTGMATAAEDNQWGKFSRDEASAERWNVPFWEPVAGLQTEDFRNWKMAASGYAAVWARENTRAALFDALVRKETYATTGPRMTVRFFGGWGFAEGDEDTPDLAERGYAAGVPMGGDLPAAPEPVGRDGAKAPTFLVSALRDPEGANLDRVQVIKGWRATDGSLHERVYDVALSGGREVGADGRARQDVGSTVDLAGPSYSNSIGAAQLSAFWRDPDFEPEEAAFYYVRVIEIPKPRWTAYDAQFFGIEMDEAVPKVTRDRAYTSPIWYTPPG